MLALKAGALLVFRPRWHLNNPFFEFGAGLFVILPVYGGELPLFRLWPASGETVAREPASYGGPLLR